MPILIMLYSSCYICCAQHAAQFLTATFYNNSVESATTFLSARQAALAICNKSPNFCV
jgi:hypothetical protein